MDDSFKERLDRAGKANPSKFGTHLRVERQNRGLTLEEVSEATKIRVTYLEAIENEDLTKLPAPTFTKGFIRSYCRYIQINDNDMVMAYTNRVGTDGCRDLDISTFRAKTNGEKMVRFMGSLKRMLTGTDTPFFR
jgi:cytoskeletal protein RodZ